MKKLIIPAILTAIIGVACASEQQLALELPDLPMSLALDEATEATEETAEEAQAIEFIFSDDAFTIFLPQTMRAVAQEREILAYLSQLAQSAGQNIRFETYQQLRQRQVIVESDGNSAFVVSQHEAVGFQREGLVGNFYEAGRSYAPSFMEMAEHAISPGSMYITPTQIMSFPLGPVVFIRNDIYDGWRRDGGNAIQNIRDYEALLMWISAREGGTSPGLLVIITEHWDHYSGFTPLELFLEDYTPMVGMFIQEAGVPTVLWMNNETGEMLSFNEIPDAVDAMLRPLEWRDRGLIEFWDGNREVELGSQFPTIAGNLNDTPAIDWGSYTMHYLAPATMAVTNSGWGGVAIIPHSTDAEPFFSFLEWLTIPENYKLLLYGVEGVDHLRNDNGYIIEILNEHLVGWHGRSFFRNSSIERHVYNYSTEVLTFLDEIENIPHPTFPLDFQQRQEIGVQLATDRVYLDSLGNMQPIMHLLFMQIYNDRMQVNEARELVEGAFRRIGVVRGLGRAQELLP